MKRLVTALTLAAVLVATPALTLAATTSVTVVAPTQIYTVIEDAEFCQFMAINQAIELNVMNLSDAFYASCINVLDFDADGPERYVPESLWPTHEEYMVTFALMNAADADTEDHSEHGDH